MADGTDVFPTFHLEANTDCEAVVIYGDNASGKSFIGRILDARFHGHEWNSKAMNMGLRVSCSGLSKAAIYGDETEQSTGVTSFKATLRALSSTSKTSGKAFLLLDEPDIGLSPRYARALGKHIAETFNEMKGVKRLAIVSHNQALIQAFLDNCERNVGSLGIGTNKGLKDWIDDPSDIEIEELIALEEMAFKRHSAIDRQLLEIRRTKNISSRAYVE